MKRRRRPRVAPLPKEWLALDDMKLSQWFEVGWLVRKRRIRHRDFDRVKAVIREVKARKS